MGYSLGLDGGGTKTDCAVLDDAGTIAGRGTAGPSNPLRVGIEAATSALAVAATQALSGAGLRQEQVRAVGAGLAGAGNSRVADSAKAFLQQTFPQAHVCVVTDLEIALEAAAGSGPGVVLIAGTGSFAFGRNAAGQTARAGGYGPWISDEGSAFDIGRRALAAVAHARDFAVPATRLADRILASLGATWEDLVAHLAKTPDDVFPKVFPLVLDAANAGDAVALEILRNAANALAELAVTVVRRLELEKKEFVLAKSGGVFAQRSPLEARLNALLENWFPRAKIGPLEVSPAVGAARLAARAAGQGSGRI